VKREIYMFELTVSRNLWVRTRYVRQSEIDLARQIYTNAITLETIGSPSPENVMRVAELKQEVESDSFAERLKESINKEEFLKKTVPSVLSQEYSNEVKLAAARNCINKAESYMTIYEKLSCLRVIILSGNDPYSEKWKNDAIALAKIVLRNKTKVEKIISLYQEPKPTDDKIVEIGVCP
jgi:hypothetical protein